MQVEMADIFDENDVYTGITVPKHTPLLPGQFKRHAVIILKTEKGYGLWRSLSNFYNNH